MRSLQYAAVTPARNEADFIEKTIQSMIAQTHRPVKWVIVSDGSTDGTDDIVKGYLDHYPWIQFIRMPERSERQFAAKVHAFRTGYAQLDSVDFDLVANVDADISFESDYFPYIMKQFAKFPELGVAGTAFMEHGKLAYDYRYTNIEHVSGQCQVFRRECFDDIGGYQPVKGGGIDWIAVTTARMKGWQTRTFTDKYFIHHRTMGTGSHSALMAHYKHGQKDYSLGNHPVWQIFRSIYQMANPPYIIGGAMLLLGYAVSSVRGAGRPINDELMTFCRSEQINRLKTKFGLIRTPS